MYFLFNVFDPCFFVGNKVPQAQNVLTFFRRRQIHCIISLVTLSGPVQLLLCLFLCNLALVLVLLGVNSIWELGSIVFFGVSIAIKLFFPGPFRVYAGGSMSFGSEVFCFIFLSLHLEPFSKSSL